MDQDQCINCCVPVSKKSKILGTQILKESPTSSEPIKATIFITSVLNYIYKGTGKEIRGIGDHGPHGLCPDCWDIVFQLYTLHKKLEVVTKVHSLINQTFHLLGPIEVAEPKSETVPITIETRPGRSNSKNKRSEPVTNETELEPSSSAKTPVNLDLDLPQQHGNLEIVDSEHVSEQSNSLVEEILVEPKIEHFVDDYSSDMDMDVDNDLFNPCYPAEDPLALALPGSSTSTTSQTQEKDDLRHLRYSGPCSEPDCDHIFEYCTKQEVGKHFVKCHARKIELQIICHICWEPLEDLYTDRLRHFNTHTHKLNRYTALRECVSFNSATLRSKCGLVLTKDAFMG